MDKVLRKNITYRFSDKEEAVVKVSSGAQILFETMDAHSGTVPAGAVGEDVAFIDLNENNANPVTGLVYIDGADVGDTLAVKIKKINLVGAGFIPVRPKTGVVFDMAPGPLARVIHIQDNQWQLNREWAFPIRPMIGTIGTAVSGHGIAAMHPGDHGGNMDNNFVREGATVYLPINVPGALLGIGDVHAAMGDTEVTGGGIDICADVLVEVNVVKKGALSRKPYIIIDNLLIMCGHGNNIETAIQSVAEEAISVLSEQMSISAREAYQLISAIGDVNISQACNCQGVDVTTRLAIPMFWLN
jgi:amidase